jgi:phosphate transport system permease protein
MKKEKILNAVFKGSAIFASVVVFAMWLLFFFEFIKHSLPSIHKFGFSFLANTVWDPVSENFGALPFIFGTVFSSFLALLISLPLSLGIAIFLNELAPLWMRKPVSFLVELLAAIPSVIYGMWGIFVLSPILRNHVQPFLSNHLGFLPLFGGPYYGIGMMSAVLILSIMIIPTISSVCREIFKAVPDVYRETGLSIGATKWEMIRISVLQTSRVGIFAAAGLGLGRALGETMAVTMVIGNRPEISFSLFAPGYTMASVIANEFTEATTDVYLSALTEIGFVLFLMTFFFSFISRMIVKKYTVSIHT